MKSFTLEALTIEMQDLKKRVNESEKQRERESRTMIMSYPPIGFRKPDDKKTDDADKAEDEEDRQD